MSQDFQDKHLSRYFILLIISVTIVTDQVTKFFAKAILIENCPFFFFKNIVTFQLVENNAGFLGILNGFNDFFRLFFLNIIVSFFLGLCLTYLLSKKSNDLFIALPMSLLTGGGMSNLLDRLLHGGVTDFIYFDLFIFQTGILNLADIYILVGSFLLGYRLFSSTTSRLAP